jgi:hypothetical protein
MRSLQGAVIALLITLAACGDGDTSVSMPTAPTAQPAPTPAGPRGQIAIVTVTPPSGATLMFRDCRRPESGFPDVCTRDWEIAADVQIDRDVDRGVLVAAFYAASQRCGFAWSAPMPLVAGSSRSFTMSHVTLSTEEIPMVCPLPVTITRVVLEFYESSRPAQALLTQKLSATYTFLTP